MVVDVEGTWDLLKGVPVTLWMLSSVVLLSTQIGPVNCVHEFTAHRMQQFDLYGSQYGSRSALVNMEARGEEANMLNRKCVIVRWVELSLDKVLEIVERGAGSILVLLPPDINLLEEEILKEWRTLEADLLAQKVSVPVYFAEEDVGLSDIYRTVSENAEKETKSSALSRLLAVFDEDGYQMISSDQKESQPNKDVHIHTVMGTLLGSGMEHKLPTLAILAHYDTMGLATSVPTNTGGSGVAAVLEIARLFSRLYSDPKLRPKHNLVFVLSGGGKFNYFGTKHLLDQLDNQEEDELLPQAYYTLCLDEVAGGEGLHVHVSKPPKEGSRSYQLLNAINNTRASLYPETSLPLVHKKVRLSDDLLAWEHEQFSFKKIPAATLSSFKSHTDLKRRSMFVGRSVTDIDVLARNVKTIAEGVARHLYGLSCENTSDCGEVFDGGVTSVHPEYLLAWMEFLSRYARSPQLLDREHPVVTGLEQALSKYMQDVTVYSHKPESSDPEFVTYDVPKTKMQAHRIKPALFDLFLGIGIAAYGLLWYLSVVFFPTVWPFIQSLPFPVPVRSFKPAKLD